MRQLFIPKKFSAEHMQLIHTMNRILDDFARQGYRLTLRQLYYQLVGQALIPNSDQSYKRIGSILSDARNAGLVDWEHIEDRNREMVENSHWDSPGELMRTYGQHFWYDAWDNQTTRVEVYVEKDALTSVLEPVCRRNDVGFTANKGYSSSSAMYEAGQRIGDHLSHGLNVVLLYLGDHDPSGIHMTQDVEERIKLYAGVRVYDQDDPTGRRFYETDDADLITVKRLALNMDQVRQYKPPPNPAKISDSRSDKYIAKYGDKSWELDALQPGVLVQLVEDAIDEHRDEEQWERSMLRRDKARQLIKELAIEADKRAAEDEDEDH